MPENKTTDARLGSLHVEYRPISALKPNSRNTRVHPKKQIRQLANSILAFGFTVPILVDENGEVLAGHARLEAGKLAGLKLIPVIVIAGLSPAKKRALLLA